MDHKTGMLEYTLDRLNEINLEQAVKLRSNSFIAISVELRTVQVGLNPEVARTIDSRI